MLSEEEAVSGQTVMVINLLLALADDAASLDDLLRGDARRLIYNGYAEPFLTALSDHAARLCEDALDEAMRRPADFRAWRARLRHQGADDPS